MNNMPFLNIRTSFWLLCVCVSLHQIEMVELNKMKEEEEEEKQTRRCDETGKISDKARVRVRMSS